MKEKLLLSILTAIIVLSSCRKELQPDKGPFPNPGARLKIAVVSDIHYMNPSLLKNNAAGGAAFQAYLDADPKLIEFSDPIFRTVITQLKSENPDILLVPSDLTKDGVRVSYNTMALLLKQLTDAHIKVYVVPGNHDVNNPESATYDGDNVAPPPQ
jgi:3',5'-cyclic AMP phosphodiesterase CpdA